MNAGLTDQNGWLTEWNKIALNARMQRIPCGGGQ
jgi:ABC-type Fe2+-enterobactin transport system substrate-binding protein